MKRIHLLEFEDQAWFPSWQRDCMTRLLLLVHRIVGTTKELPKLVLQTVQDLKTNKIVDLCSGGGPMPDVVKTLRNNHQLKITLTLTDLYPHQQVANRINDQEEFIRYITESVDATNVRNDLRGLRTMVSGFHHMTPDNARKDSTFSR